MKKILLWLALLAISLPGHGQSVDINKDIRQVSKEIKKAEKFIQNNSFDYDNPIHRELKDSSLVAMNLLLANLYISKGDTVNSNKVYKKLTETIEEGNPNYSGWMFWPVLYYMDTKQYEPQIATQLKILDYTKRHLGDDSKEYFSDLLNLAYSYYSYRKFDEAWNVISNLLNQNLDSYVDLQYQTMSLTIDVYQAVGQHNEAIELCYQLLDNSNLDQQRKAEIIHKLIFSFEETGDVENAIGWNQHLVSEAGGTVEFLDNEASRYLLAMDPIGELHFRWKALDLRGELYGEESAEYGKGLILVANAMTHTTTNCDSTIVSNFTSAGLDLLLRNNSDEFHSLLGYAANNLKGIGNYDDAEIYIYSAVDERMSKGDTLSTLNSIISWADINRLQKKYTESSNLYYFAIDYLQRNNIKTPSADATFVDCIIGIAKNEEERHNYQLCEELLYQTLTALDDVIIPSKDIRIKTVYSHLLSLYHNTQEYSKLISLIKQNFEYLRGDIFSKWLFLSSDQRDVYWHQNNLLFVIAPAIHLKERTSADMSTLFSMTLLKKGLLLTSEIELKKHIIDSGDKALTDKYRRLQTINSELERQWSDSLVYLSEQIERELLQEGRSFGDYTRNLRIDWQDVRNTLYDTDVAIEFIDFSLRNSDSLMYAALILKNDWDTPRMIPLFEKKEFDKLIPANNDANKIYTGYIGKEISKLIWGPLAEYIKEDDNVYFSPSGVLHHLAIESLPSDDGRLMSERYNMCRLSSTRELCYDYHLPQYGKAVLYGGLTYDLDDDTMVAQSRAYSEHRDLYAMRGFEADSVNRAGWGNLPGTKTEVNNISRALSDKSITVAVYEDIEGNEESFRTLSGQQNDIIHIATHGFFLPLEKARRKEYFGLHNDDAPVVDNSMRRSGLIMAGGNKAWRGEPVPDGVEDGVLTSQEIVSLDLRDADLVVLSACETGLGEVTGEGVFGLQRAFKKAGAQTLIMSLWKVSDAATEVMMSEFYTHLLAGKSKRESFLSAQSAVRRKFPEPYYWAAFIMLD